MLKFHERFNDAILSGNKTQTVRPELKVCVGEIHAVINPSFDFDNGSPLAFVRITWFSYEPLNKIDLKAEGFSHIDDLIAFLAKAYGYEIEFTPMTQVYVIHFELTEAPNEDTN